MWDNVAQSLDSATIVRKYWSEADFLHCLASEYVESLRREGLTLNVHVAPSLLPSVFDNPLRRNLERYLAKNAKRRIIPDLIVQKTDDIRSPFELCAELKYRMGGHPYWRTWIDGENGVKKDLLRLPELKRSGICEEIAMMVAYDPDPPNKSEASELRGILRSSDKNLTIMSYLAI